MGLHELAAQGHTDFIAIAHLFGSGGVIDLDGLCLHELDHSETRGIPCRGVRGTAAAGADTGAEGHVAGG
jgi:hypothetical protein